MKAILIDDERPSLVQLERLLQTAKDIEIAGRFLSAQEGLDFLAQEKVDIVFLDISMPEMNGLVVGKYIQQMDFSIRIVYITAYSQHALAAFEINALDYLLKPINPVRLAKTLERIRSSIPRPSVVNDGTPDEPDILCFKSLAFSGDPDGGGKTRWRTLKNKELFAFLLHHKGKWMAKDLLLEMLWSHMTFDKSIVHLHTSIYQLRKMIRETRLNATLEFSLDSYRLSGQGLLTDAELFEHRCREAAEEWDDTQLQQVDWTLNLYRGHYLEERDYPWARVRRDQLLQLFLQLVLKTARCEMAQGRVRQAILRLMRTLDIEPGAEEACQLLMRAYGELGDYAGLQRCYATLVQFLRNELAVEPQPQTQECYAGLMSANSRTSLT